MSTEIYETYGTADVFCEALGRIERIGSCRRLVFVVSEHNGSGRPIVAKLVIPAEVMADLVQMIAADRPEPGAFDRLFPIAAVKH